VTADKFLPTRREAIVTGAAAASLTALVPGQALAVPASEARNEVSLALLVNGERHDLELEPRVTLLDTLRERLGLFGTKKGCDIGQCGACTVHIDGRRVLSCLTLAVQAGGREVTTIEGIGGPGGGLHPMQQAFLDHDALQCGYCTPGQVMSAIACVDEGHATTDDDVREYMSGNLCRCGAYRGIVAAIRDVAGHG
jgi:xanthine dehydrogenase YagT iron-sulfur-binding subunit